QHPDFGQGVTYLMAAWAVGKFDMPIFKSASSTKYTRFSLPLEQASNNWFDVIGEQLVASNTPGQADQVMQWHGSGWNALYYKSAADGWQISSGNTFNFTFGEGFLLRIPERANQADSVVTIVGDVKHNQFAIDDDYEMLAVNQYTIFAHPFPIFFTLDDAGFKVSGAFPNNTPGSADQIYKWTGTGWVAMYLSDNPNAPYWLPLDEVTTFDFVPGWGYTYRKGSANQSTGYNWILNPYPW
ncbi:MAG: hypothetical protein KJ732_00520, partial [Candidatus Margulisbacteria bacterium]|nr:hypothetical protein [Candidatus Margulisiibacteriota bacterium]